MAEYIIEPNCSDFGYGCEVMEHIVRCRDCMFNAKPNEGKHFGICERHNDSIVTHDGFCAWGRKKD